MNTTPPPVLYAPREPIFPRRVTGVFRRFKWAILIVTLGIYYLTPWIRWDRGPNLPDQAVLVDIASRRFYFVAGLLIMAGLGLFLFTSALGRVWCGYTCPQTVWTDLFILVERWIEGDRNARVRLHNAKWDVRKWRLRLTKWTVWLAISVATGGAWVFYFTDAPQLLVDLFTLSAHPAAYGTVAVLTATTFVFGGFMREQVCIYMCPWPRIQAAMMDPDTITVAYRDWRGEPRGKGSARKRDRAAAEKAEREAQAAGSGTVRYKATPYPNAPIKLDSGTATIAAPVEEHGDCIDCMALSDEAAERAGGAPKSIWRHVLRPRTLLYTAMWASIGFGLVYALFIRSDIELTVSPVRNPTYVVQSDGSIRNIYDVRLRNKLGEDRLLHLSLTSAETLRIELQGRGDELNVLVPADTTVLQRVYISARPQDAASAQHTSDLRIWVEDIESGERASRATSFNGRVQ